MENTYYENCIGKCNACEYKDICVKNTITPPRESEIKLNNFVDLVPVGIGANNFDGSFTKIFSNKGYYDVLGFTEEEFLERFPLGGIDAFHPDDKDRVRQAATVDLKETGFVYVRTRIAHKTKGYIWVQYSGRLVQDTGEKPKVYISMVDISDVIEASEQLANTVANLNEAEEKLRTEREINEFAVETKYNLVSLLNVQKRELIVYKKNKEFTDGGLKSEGDYDTAANFVMNNLVHPDDHENFKRLFFDNLIREVDEKEKLVLEYRLFNTETGSYHWKRVLYRYFMNSKNMIIQLTEDIDNDMKVRMKMEADYNLNNMIADLIGDGFFDCDISTKTIKYSKNFADRFGLPEIVTGYPESIIDKGFIGQDSLYLFKNRFLGKIERMGDEVVHLLTPSKEDVWCQYLYTVIKDEKGRPIRAVGKITDITKQYLKMAELTDKAKKDQLTNLYNKATTESMIKENLENIGDRSCALMIIDIDNFKSINDNLGHIYGDIALTELGNLLGSYFSPDGIVGRVGGDEFFVFIREYKNIDSIKTKAEEICKILKKSYTEGSVTVNISGSVGIALAPSHGREFDQLYKAADVALYKAKAKGKNQYCIYDGVNENSYTIARTEIDSHENIQKTLKSNRVEFIFRMLYEAEGMTNNIEAVLKLIGEHFGFDRVTIHIVNTEKETSTCQYEWCSKGILSLKESRKNVPNNEFDYLIKACKKNKKLFTSKSATITRELASGSLNKDAGVKSAVYFPLFSGNLLWGNISFHNCKDDNIRLTDKDLDDMNTMCGIVATFLLKKYNSEREIKYQKSVSTILHNMDGYVYVIDKDSYMILFENKKVKDLIGHENVGKVCHKAYVGKNEPCESCPVRGLDRENKNQTIEMYNEEFDIYSRSTGALIEWTDGKEAYMINSIDITEYKK